MTGYVHPPADDVLPAFPEAKRARPKTGFAGGKRRRWKDKSRVYEWDYENGRVEIYNQRGEHLGEYDPLDGKQTKDADPKRHVEP